MRASPLPAAMILGTRASRLARAQTETVAALLVTYRIGLECEMRVIATTGDRTQASGEPLPEIGGKGLFTAELERALSDGDIDVAVHSLKDLPTEETAGVVIGAVIDRDLVGDCLVARDRLKLDGLPQGAVVGTSSLRRMAQLRLLRPDLDVRSIRGNVETRVAKVFDGEYDAIVIAAAGVARIGVESVVTEWLATETMLPAPGQGALAVQCRADDRAMLDLLGEIDDPKTRAETTAERSFLRALGGGCAAPVAALAKMAGRPSDKVSQGMLVRMEALVAAVDGSEIVRVSGEGEPGELGERLAGEALAAGADRILAAIRG